MQCEQSERFGDFYYLCVNCAGLNNVGGGGERLKILFEAKRKQRGIILLNGNLLVSLLIDVMISLNDNIKCFFLISLILYLVRF